ncbi:Protein of unknown function [Cotesia congregata]|uniref:Uncharacterized protein n=1 Tax=Cotesia congregata TaxID=51543 RepID=A0A8J2HQE5_COTCN|nr:Protein of unknown function [Cotesia congregata]
MNKRRSNSLLEIEVLDVVGFLRLELLRGSVSLLIRGTLSGGYTTSLFCNARLLYNNPKLPPPTFSLGPKIETRQCCVVILSISGDLSTQGISPYGLEDMDINKMNRFFNNDPQTKKNSQIYDRSDYYLEPYENIKKKNLKSIQNDRLRLITEHFLNFKIQKISEKKNLFLERLKKPYIIHHFRSLYNPLTNQMYTSNYLKPFRQSHFIADKNIFNHDDTTVGDTHIGQQNNDLVTSEISGNGIIIHPQKESAMRNKTKIQTNRESIIDFNKENVEFTYSFNGLTVEFVDTRFAITPNDPNYNSSDNYDINDKTHKESKKFVNFKEIIYVRVPKEDTPSNSKFLSDNSLVSKNQKKFNNGPTQITSNYKIIDDIYFVTHFLNNSRLYRLKPMKRLSNIAHDGILSGPVIYQARLTRCIKFG